ncbi:hypothetical protein GCM10011490_20790 [Pseudoclavibacter endophyticus]|uniref:DUF4177 domain-containing protein n=1 Tax=Pseudoclavibacter endophyticus TaxID=1778590 RepID=A0A6H9WBU2_9MICO|nr:DUF4177 domain-containing protein [Pseudoclavibacter endophyticus]KAB1648133.1 DUF4177 domain-containing protein [Pseudoclavibacter endophyticus]GGA69998.1 hypothetical protein GCM10011490_20790 [Pseudoclavibacter endophyticus]
MQQWEYFITPLPLHTPAAILNNLGKQGWELVQVIMNADGGSVAYLKRPLGSEAGS